ncbi:putative ribonuclease H-like domain-containing protein [Tanacetum coccineum]
MTDAKKMWDASNIDLVEMNESKKMQKYILKQQFEGFSVSNTEGLHKGYDRFQSLLSQLEISWVEVVSTEGLQSNKAYSQGLKELKHESELEKQPLYDRFVTADGMHAVPPPMTGNYMPSGPEIEVDYSQFTYGPKQTQPSESESQTINTIKPIVNRVRPANVFHKTHSPSSRPFKKTTVPRTDFSKQKVNTAKVNAVSTVGRKRETAVKSSVGFAQGHRQEEGIDYDEVFAPVAMIEAIRIFLAFASYMGFIVYQMDVKSAFLYGKIDEEVYVSQPPGFLDPKYPQKVYKVNGYRIGTIDKTLFTKKDKHDIILVQVYVDDIIFGSTKKSWCDEFEALMKSQFQMSSMGELTFFLGLQVKQKADGSFISQDKSMIGSLMHLTASRPDIMFAVCACSRVSSFDLESYSDSDYAGANLDRKSTTGGCQFLGRRLISWQCKKQTIVATSTTEAEYVAAASCCGQVLWIQNQMLDYGFNFMNTKIYIDNESTICIVKNPVYHSKTKHIAIRHHFIRDAYEKKLIQVLKIHTDDNVADLLTKAFDVSRGLIEFRESLRRVTDGTEALLIPTLFILWLDKVSTDSAKLVPLGKVCTAIETLKKNTAKGTNTMAVLDSCPKHNMVAYLEKSEGNAEFHEIIDFLKRSSIHHALTVSPVVSTTFVEQFWTSAKSKIINNVRHITAKVAGKSVSISEASIRSDLLFDDADGIDSLPNQAIFDAIQLMGKTSETQPHPLLLHTREVPIVPQTDSSPLTLVKYLLAIRSVHPRPSPSTIIPDSIPETSGGNLGGHSSSDKSLSGNEGEMTLQSVYDLCLSLCTQVSDQAKEIQHLKAQIKKLKKQAKPGRKFAKGKSSVQRDPLFDEIPDDTIDHMETENAQDVGRTKELLASDEEMARKIQEEWEGEEERNRLAEEKATNEALIRNFDDIKARIEADRLLAEKLQEQEREQFTIEERAKFLHDIIAAQRKFLAQQRSEAIRNRPPTKNQLRNQMMTYLKHVGNFKHAELKIKKFEEIQALYEKIKRSDEDFTSIGSAEDERLIIKRRDEEKGIVFLIRPKSEVIKEESKEEVQEESKEEESKRKRKLGTRKKMKSRKRRFIQNTSEDDSEKENDELRLHLTIAPDEEKEVDYEILDKKYPIKEWKTECLGTKPQDDKAEHLEEINQNVVIRSNGQKRYFSTLMKVLYIFDRGRRFG